MAPSTVILVDCDLRKEKTAMDAVAGYLFAPFLESKATRLLTIVISAIGPTILHPQAPPCKKSLEDSFRRLKYLSKCPRVCTLLDLLNTGLSLLRQDTQLTLAVSDEEGAQWAEREWSKLSPHNKLDIELLNFECPLIPQPQSRTFLPLFTGVLSLGKHSDETSSFEVPIQVFPAVRRINWPLHSCDPVKGEPVLMRNGILRKSNMRSGYLYGTSTVELDVVPPLICSASFEILCFTSVPPWMLSGPSNHVVPTTLRGGTSLSVLAVALERTGKSAIVRYVPFEDAEVQLLALQSSGFNLVTHSLPFCDGVSPFQFPRLDCDESSVDLKAIDPKEQFTGDPLNPALLNVLCREFQNKTS